MTKKKQNKKTLKLTCEASSYGVGAVISYVGNKEEKPVAYSSRTLSAAEKNYAHIERKLLTIVFGIQKFHKYLYVRVLTIVTDHRRSHADHRNRLRHIFDAKYACRFRDSSKNAQLVKLAC